MNKMKRTAIFAAVMVCLLLLKQIVFSTPLNECIYDYFAVHHIRYNVYRVFWMLVRIGLIASVGTSLYVHRRQLPRLQKGHTWFTLCLAAAFSVPVVWSLCVPQFYGGIPFCYTNAYYMMVLMAALLVWFVLLSRANYETFESEGTGLIGALSAYSALLILGATIYNAYIQMQMPMELFTWSSNAMASWLMPAFIAIVLWIFGIINLIKK